MKRLMVMASVLLVGCANSKYPGWQSVTIVDSVEGQPCMRNGVAEQCKDTWDDCEPWFKKRATLARSNTVMVAGSGNDFSGRYFHCRDGLPPYKKAAFNKAAYGPELNTVTGQAFLTQRGGGVVTCAGKTVIMRPDNQYFNEKFQDIDRGMMPEHRFSKDEEALIRTTRCDAQGNFEFYKIPSGQWMISTNVSWDVPFVMYTQLGWYTDMRKQGGGVMQSVTVQSGEINRFIVSE
jgi:hypothetical protein